MALHPTSPSPIFVLRVLRGLSQVMLQKHAATGLLFLIGRAAGRQCCCGGADRLGRGAD